MIFENIRLVALSANYTGKNDLYLFGEVTRGVCHYYSCTGNWRTGINISGGEAGSGGSGPSCLQ